MKVFLSLIFAFLSLILITGEGIAITIDDIQDMSSVTPSALANSLVGSGNVVSGSAVYTGAPAAAGTFRDGLSDGLGIDQGVILTTGDIYYSIGPNRDGMVGMSNFAPGDASLNGIVSGGTFNASVLEFRFIPPQNRVTFTFVFASDEYPEFVGTLFNDVFGLFVNGENIARIPGSTSPVTINTLNNVTTPTIFNDNSDIIIPRFSTQYDGFSNAISVSAIVTPGISSTLKIAIADTADPSVDSAVFLGPAVFSTVATFSISGTVTRAGGVGVGGGGTPLAGVTMTISGAANRTTTTDLNGNYTFTGLVNGSYTVTPSLTGFAFTPLSRAVTINNANVTGQNFTAAAAAATFSISGSVTTGGGIPMAGVTIALTGTRTGTTTTDTNGNYTFAGLVNGSYTVTPSLIGFVFTPVNRAVTINNANVTGQNFVGTAAAGAFLISGTVRTVGGGVGPGGGLGAPVAGVAITLSGLAAGNTTTDANGNYTFPGLANGNYTVTPSLAGFAFTPVNRAVTINNANVTGQNFTATVVTATFSISGTVSTGGGSPISGVTMTLSGAAAGTATTDANGNYTFAGLANGNYTVTPSLAGFTFTPLNRAVTINNANMPGQDFVGTVAAGTFSISGTVRNRVLGVGVGTPVQGVTMTLGGTSSGTATTDTNGNYTFAGLTNGDYTVTPSQTGRTFTPASRAVTINNANVAGQNFTRN